MSTYCLNCCDLTSSAAIKVLAAFAAVSVKVAINTDTKVECATSQGKEHKETNKNQEGYGETSRQKATLTRRPSFPN